MEIKATDNIYSIQHILLHRKTLECQCFLLTQCAFQLASTFINKFIVLALKMQKAYRVASCAKRTQSVYKILS